MTSARRQTMLLQSGSLIAFDVNFENLNLSAKCNHTFERDTVSCAFSSSLLWKCACTLCSSAARVLRGVPVFVVRPGENVPAVSLYCHWDPAMLERRHHLGSLSGLLSFDYVTHAPGTRVLWHELDNGVLSCYKLKATFCFTLNTWKKNVTLIYCGDNVNNYSIHALYNLARISVFFIFL